MASNHERSFKSAARFFSRSPAGEQRLPHRHHIRQVDIIEAALPIVTGAACLIQAAAQIHNSGPRVVAQIVTHLPGQVALAHGRFHRPEGLHQAAGRLLQGGEVVIQPLQQFHGQRIGKQLGKTPGTQRPGVQGDHQRLLYGVFLNVVFHRHPPMLSAPVLLPSHQQPGIPSSIIAARRREPKASFAVSISCTS